MWKKVESKIWRPESGEVLEGVFTDVEHPEGAHSALYVFQTKTHGTIGVWGCAVLDDLLAGADKGDILRLTYGGKKKNSRGQEMHLYGVERWDDDDTIILDCGERA